MANQVAAQSTPESECGCPWDLSKLILETPEPLFGRLWHRIRANDFTPFHTMHTMPLQFSVGFSTPWVVRTLLELSTAYVGFIAGCLRRFRSDPDEA